MIQYLYPTSDVNLYGWNTHPGTEGFSRIDEGTGTTNQDNIFQQALAVVDTHYIFSGIFGLDYKSSFVIPSSLTFNLDAQTSGIGVPSPNPKLYLTDVRIRDNYTNKIVSQWYGVSSEYNETRSVKSFTLSSFSGTAPYGNYNFEIRLSGTTSPNPPSQSSRYLIHAAEFVSSGDYVQIASGIPLYIAGPIPQNSSIPLYLHGPQPTIECLTTVGTSGDYDTSPDYQWLDNNSLANYQWDSWYTAVDNGIHTPEDSTYIYLQDNLNKLVGEPEHYYRTTPTFRFNKPTMQGFSQVKFCFRASEEYTPGYSGLQPLVSDILLRNANGTTINSWTGPIYISGSTLNYCTSGQSTNPNNWSPINNQLTFSYQYPTVGDYSAGTKFYEIEICVSGFDVSHSGYIPLYISGIGSSNSGIPLYIEGYDVSSSGIPLYISGPITNESGIPLYINGITTSQSGIPLYVCGHITESSGIPLYIQGHAQHSGSMPLYLKTTEPGTSNNGIPLYTYSTSSSGLYGSIPLSITGTGMYQAEMPLYLKCQEYGETTASMPLFLKMGNLNGTITSENGIPLFLQNSYVEYSGYIPLFLQTQSGTLGAIPNSSWMPLFIARDSEGYASQIPLFVKVADSIESGIPLYTFGAYTSSSGIPLVIPNVIGGSSGFLKLYVNGY